MIAGFATSAIVMIKMIGVGMLVAVLLDATVVRALLVPATMRLLGRANWWAPAPLARWWERHGHGRRGARGAPGRLAWVTVMASVRSLRRDEAIARARTVTVLSYDIALDLRADGPTFRSTTRLVLDSTGGRSFLQVQPARVHRLLLDGDELPGGSVRRGRLTLDLSAGRHEITVDAELAYRTDGEGLHRSQDPADGRTYVYAMTFMDAAPTVFACFDQPDLKAPVTLRVAPPGLGGDRQPHPWPAATAPGGTSSPLHRSSYLVGLVAGPYHVLREEHDGIPLGLSARASLAEHLEDQADDLFTVTRQSFDELHRLFGIRHPFASYHQAFVPDFNAGAMESPGCVTLRDPLLFTSRVTRAELITRAVTMAHEMAHQWFGNLTSPVWWDDLWLNESFAEYLGTRVAADATQYADAWVLDAHTRRPWGMAADLRPSTHPVAGTEARDTAGALLDFDGISYAKGAAVLRQLNVAVGDEVFLGGVVDHFERHWFGNATMADLLESWERAGAPALSAYVDQWLRTAGADTLAVDREGHALTCSPPVDHPARRRHRLHVAVAASDGGWVVTAATATPPRTPLTVAPGAAVVPDAYAETWAVSHLDENTQAAIADLVAATDDPRLRAGIWSAVRASYHEGLVPPLRAVEIVESAAATEDVDHVARAIAGWTARSVIPCATTGRCGRPAPPGLVGARLVSSGRLGAPARGLPGGRGDGGRRRAPARLDRGTRGWPPACGSTRTCAGGSWGGAQSWGWWGPPSSTPGAVRHRPPQPTSSMRGPWRHCPTPP
ncbi:MAG: M1 family aminopeptidase [Nocardioides sp.]